MIRDVFYYGTKPNVHPREQYAESINDARAKATTEHFWIVNEFCDYKNFDWDFDFDVLPDSDVWAEAHNNVWPSVHQKDSGTWLCPKEYSDIVVYRNDVDPLRRKNIKNECWVELDLIDHAKFDFSWHPDITVAPYIYKWGCKFYPAQIKHVLEYRVPNATQVKYMDNIVELLPEDKWVEVQEIDKSKFDMSWRPNPLDPPMNYVWGNKFIDGRLKSTLEYRIPHATDTKYMPDLLSVIPEWDKWVEVQPVDKNKFDFSWRPDPREPAYIYIWGNKYIDAEIIPTLEYHCEGATDRKYMGNDIEVLPEWDKWIIPDNLDTTGFDFSWRPDPREPNYIYEFGTQWQKTGGPMYVVPEAVDKKYLDLQKVKCKFDMTNWYIPSNIDKKLFDFSWHPDSTHPPYIYIFATQWAFSGGPVYTVPGATEVKYLDEQVATAIKDMSNWVYDENLIDIEDFDFSWNPHIEDQPYIYEFGTQWQKTGGPRYIVEGASTESPIKYIDSRIIKSKRLPDMNNPCWHNNYKIKSFDYSWHPDSTEEPYIYVFGNNLYPAEIMPTIEYIVPGATQIKHINDIVATLGPDRTNWVIFQPIDEDKFDFSWKPNPKDPPYIYVWGNSYIDGKIKSTVEYQVDGATEKKYMDELVEVTPEWDRWDIPKNIDTTAFDFTWRPDPLDADFIWQFGTQWQKTGGPRYIVTNATEVKYVDFQKAKRLTSTDNWTIPSNIDISNFDFSWHPDDTSSPYIYVFSTQWALSGGPVYIVPGATEVKYVEDQKARALSDMSNWQFDPGSIDEASFDFSWHPYAEDEPYIYQIGTQWQKTGGPRYIVEGATNESSIKYIDNRVIKAKRLPNINDPCWHNNYKIKSFDYSWHPDSTEEPYIYIFGSNQYPAEEMPAIEYRVSGATQVKYINDIVAVLDEDSSNWEIPDNIDITGFDFTWKPNPKDPPYIYEFGTQWQKTGGPRYIVEGAVEVKYIDSSIANRLPSDENWTVPKNIDITNFDFSWHPDSTSLPYIYKFATQWALSGGPVYTVSGSTEIKYVEDQKARAVPDKTNWQIDVELIDENSFDFSWHPYIEDEPYIYQFGTQHQKTGGPKYITPGCHNNSSIKYIDTRILKATRLPNEKNFVILNDLNIKAFDYSWHPDDTEEPYIYIFGNTQYPAEKMPTIEYRTEGATQIKYVHDVVATLDSNINNWQIPSMINVTGFDFSWTPDPQDPPYIYQFGTQWALTGGPRYVVPGATEVKYVNDITAISLPTKENWDIPINVDVNKFDFSWHPYEQDDPFIYQFGTQWQKTGGPRYVVPGATKVKYVDKRILKSHRLPSRDNWEIPAGIDVSKFDFSWHPDDTAPPVIYQFGTIENITDGPRYIVPDNSGEIVNLERVETEEIQYIDYPRYEIETTLEDLIKKHPTEIFWATNSSIDYTGFDFDWRPSIEQAKYVQVFGSSDSELTQTYFVNASMWNQGFRDLNWIEDSKLDDKTLAKLFKKPDMFYVDRGNKESQSRFDMLKSKFPQMQKTRYLNSWVDTINRCTNRATTPLLWILNSELDYTHFDFEYYPNPWQMKMVHVFGTQWSHWGTTFMVNRDSFSEDTKYIKIIEHLSNLNFIKNSRAKATECLYDILLVDHGNDESTKVKESLQEKILDRNLYTVPYDTSYLITVKNFIKTLQQKKEHYLWVCSTVCDYSNFDFTYICDPFAKENLHVFPSGAQKFGDTFLLDVNKTRYILTDIDKLEDYTKINYNNSVRADRLPEPIIITDDDTHINSVKNINGFPYATLITSDNKNIDKLTIEPMNLWSQETKNILITSTGSSRITVPKEAKDHIKTQLYDYPYIKRAPKVTRSNPIDIVFLSNGESIAEDNYQHLLDVTKGLSNRVVRVDGINGRVKAYHAAAEASNTPWFFTVFGKLKVSPKFDWNWQPDRMQSPKHYIFHAKNPLNGLIYGHQAMIAYNKKLVLYNNGYGLDFTLDDEHEIVPLLSGTAYYNTDEFSTWRTAFREVIKLKFYDDADSRKRLDVWLNKAEGEYAQYSIKGAVDADEYYNSVEEDFDKLKLSYEWDWLRQYYLDNN